MRKHVALIIGIFVCYSCNSSPSKREVKISNIVETTKINNRDTLQSSYSSCYNDTLQYDNMRGFDPPSEDDMDDNGMSRYMENNDEEGWY